MNDMNVCSVLLGIKASTKALKPLPPAVFHGHPLAFLRQWGEGKEVNMCVLKPHVFGGDSCVGK